VYVCVDEDLTADLMSPDVNTTLFPFGLPVPLSEKLVVSLTGDKVLQLHSYLLEFSEGLALLATVPDAVAWTVSEAVRLLRKRHDLIGMI